MGVKRVRFFAFSIGCVLLGSALVAGQSAQNTSTPGSSPQPQGGTTAPGAQIPPPAPSATAGANPQSADQTSRAQKERTQEQTTGTSNDRLFWTLPNFLTVQSTHIPPLSTGTKFKVVARGTFDPVEYFYIGFLAGISQAEDSEPGYGQGAAGYGKRYGAAFADNAIENFWTGAILPSLLKQDPRYYQMGHGPSFGHRLEYAISRIFITRSDAGHRQFNISEVGGSAISAAISTYSYHPSEDRTFGNTMSVWGTQVGWDTVTIVFKEFWPDIRHHFTKNKNVGAVRESTSAPADPPKTPDK
jgi:hypothetical protein